jgi:quercetin dioxygenase-like cupin family protein
MHQLALILPKHYHTSFNETFIPIDGVLGVDVGKKKAEVAGNCHGYRQDE